MTLIALTGIVSSTLTMAQSISKKGIPNTVAFDGELLNTDGSKVPDGSYNVSFYLYDVNQGGTPLWSENYKDVRVQNGSFHILLGKDSDSNPLRLPFYKKYYIGIQINDKKETRERIELFSTPYSLGAKYATEVSDNSITTNKLAKKSVTDEKIENVSWDKLTDVDPDPYSIYWTIIGNIIYGPERNYIGTIERKDFVIKSFSIQRMLFEPFGKVWLGTVEDSVDFEVIGKSTFSDDLYIKGKMGVGVDPPLAKVHVNSQSITPFRVDHQNTKIFEIETDGRVEIISSVSGGDGSKTSYPFILDVVDQGIAIKVEGDADNDNNFVSFWDDGGMTGRIEGESYLNWLADPVTIARSVYEVALGVAEIAAIAAAPVEPASILSFGADVIYLGVEIGLDLANIGVTYESSSGDYAEWLERIDSEEVITSGDIVGIYGGRISKSTKGAEQLSCISFSPIVLGNQPEKQKETLYEKVAFLGQIPIKISGKVNAGDFIIPSGLDDGTGIAVAPEMMTIDEYSKIVGRAWSSSEKESVKYVNVAIGLSNKEIVHVMQGNLKRNKNLNEKLSVREKRIQDAREKLSELEMQFLEINNSLEDLIESIPKNITSQPVNSELVNQ